MSESKPESKPTRTKLWKKDLSMEQRLLLAFGLMGVVLLVTPYVLPSQPAAPPPKKSDTAKETKASTPAAQTPAPATQPPSPSEPVAAAAEQTFVVETDLYRVTFSNRGGVVRSWILKKYKDSKGKPLELVNPKAVAKAGYPFAVLYTNGKPAESINQALFAARVLENGLGIDFEFSGGKVYAHKTFRFQRNQYLSEFSSTFSEGGVVQPHLVAWRGGFGDVTVIGAAAAQTAVYYDTDKQSLVTKSASDAQEGPVTSRGAYSFAGLSDAYFAAVALPEASSTFEVSVLSDTAPNSVDGAEDPHVGVGLGGDGSNRATLFVGPKDIALLKSVSAKLSQLVDWGWFGVIAQPLFLVLNWLNLNYIHNYGWSIVIITVVINFLVLPLKMSSMKSMKQMQVLQPQIQAINEKYRGMGMRDPRKQQQNEEVMLLYKKHGVNPMGGCVPMLLQIPFFIAFYKVLSVAIEMRGAAWLWVDDLSRPESIAIRILPVAMIATQFVLQKMTPSTTADPAQQKVMLLMPLMLGFMFYGVSSGLVLYWLTGNLVGIAQQWFFNKTAPAAAVAPVAPQKKKK